MQLINKEKNNFELKIETLDDLWVLSQFIVPGDKVSGKTERKIKVGGEDSTKQSRKLIFINLLIDKVDYTENILRVGGKIQNETEHTAIGQHHSFNYQVGDLINIEKQKILHYEEKLLNNSIESKNSFYLLIILDKDDLLVTEFSQHSFNVLFSKNNLGSKKYKHKEINEESEKYELVKDLLNKNYSEIIIAGPGFWKEKFSKYLKDNYNISTVTFSWNDTYYSSIPKIIRNLSESGLLEENQLTYQSQKVSDLLYNINTGNKYTYGENEVSQAGNTGRISSLLITTKFISNKRENQAYQSINELMKTVEELGGEISILDSHYEPGNIIDGLGGIAAILRY